MKIIDLLNKIANNEEVPEKFKYDDLIFQRQGNYNYFDEYGDKLYKSIFSDFSNLNDEVEIIDEEYKETKPITIKDIETLGYACGEIKKCFENGWNKSLENKPLDEPKEDKIEYLNNAYKDDRFGYSIDVGKIQNKINEIIDKVNKLSKKNCE